MTAGRTPKFRWSNVPIPEPYIAGLLVGMIVDGVHARRLFESGWFARRLGAGLIALGLLVIGWALRTIGEADIERSKTLVTTGPYAFSRNPMYVGWTLLYLGIASVRNTAWPVAVLPFLSATSHLVVRREERVLEHDFGEAYRIYRSEVPRYLLSEWSRGHAG